MCEICTQRVTWCRSLVSRSRHTHVVDILVSRSRHCSLSFADGDSSGRTRIEQDSEGLCGVGARALRHVPSAQNGKKRVAQNNMLVSISGDTVVAGGCRSHHSNRPLVGAAGRANEAGSAGKRRQPEGVWNSPQTREKGPVMGNAEGEPM